MWLCCADGTIIHSECEDRLWQSGAPKGAAVVMRWGPNQFAYRVESGIISGDQLADIADQESVIVSTVRDWLILIVTLDPTLPPEFLAHRRECLEGRAEARGVVLESFQFSRQTA